MTADNLSRMMPGAFPSPSDSLSSRWSFGDTDEQCLAKENEVSISNSLLKSFMTALARGRSELTAQVPAETITTTLSGMFSSAAPDDNIILNAEEVETIFKQFLSVLQSLEKECLTMKEASEEARKQQDENGDVLQDGVLVDLQDTIITEDQISFLDLDEAMGELDLCEGKA
jgi:hypothetical protein